MAKKIPDAIKSEFPKGYRVQLHPGTDAWMQGDRYGVITGYANSVNDGALIRVKLDRSGRSKLFHPRNLAESFPASNPKARDPAHRKLLRSLDSHFAADEKALRRNPARGVANEHHVRELTLYADNERTLQNQRNAIILNLLRKYAAGKYDRSKAWKLWKYWFDSAAQAYTKEFDTPGAASYGAFSAADREQAAKDYAIHLERMIRDGEFDWMLHEKGGVHSKRLTAVRFAEGRGVKKNPDGRLVDAIGPGDRVTIVDRFGKERSGKAVMRSSHGGWVLNMGGAHGTPGIADDSNIVRVSKSKKKPSAAAYFIAGRAPNPVDKNCPHCGAFATRCAKDEPRRRATVCAVTGKVLERWPKKMRKKNPDAYVIALYSLHPSSKMRMTYDATRNRFTDNSPPSLYATKIAAKDRAELLLKQNHKLYDYRVTVEPATAAERGAVFGARPRRQNPKLRKGMRVALNVDSRVQIYKPGGGGEKRGVYFAGKQGVVKATGPKLTTVLFDGDELGTVLATEKFTPLPKK